MQQHIGGRLWKLHCLCFIEDTIKSLPLQINLRWVRGNRENRLGSEIRRILGKTGGGTDCVY